MKIVRVDYNSPLYEEVVKCRYYNYLQEGKLRFGETARWSSDKDGSIFAVMSPCNELIGTFTLHNYPYNPVYYGIDLPFRGYCEASKLAVDKRYRSARLLRVIFKEVWAWARANKCERMVLCVDKDKMKLYSRMLGFRVLPSSRFTHPVYKTRHCVMYLEDK